MHCDKALVSVCVPDKMHINTFVTVTALPVMHDI